jgi:hypothetical protein
MFFKNPNIKAGFQKMLPDDAFNQILDQGVELVRGMAREVSPTEIPPALLVVEALMMNGAPGSLAVKMMPCKLALDDDRHEHLCVMGRLAFEAQIPLVACFIMSEGWMCSDPETAKEFAPGGKLHGTRIADLPGDKKCEVVTIGGFSLDGRSNMAALGMKRDGDRVTSCDEEVMKAYFKTGGEVRAHCGLAESFVTGWMSGMIFSTGMTRGVDPMAALLKKEGVDLEKFRKGRGSCDCGQCGGEGENPEPWASDPDAWKKGG